MANKAKRTEHAGAKNGGGYHGHRADAKRESAKSRREADRRESLTSYDPMKRVEELGSGLNGKRPKLLKLLADQTVTRIVVEHRDRLARFGVEYIEAALQAQGRSLVVAEAGEQKLDLVQDFIDVVTSMCARIYGRRAASNRAKRALAAAEAAV